MKYDRKTRAWFRREMSGKTALAQNMDLLLTTLLALFASYVWFLSRLQSQSLAVLLAIASGGVVLVLLLLWRSMRLDAFIRSYSAQLHSKALLEHLLLQTPESIRAMIESSLSLSGSHQIGKDLFINRDCLYGLIQRHPNEPYEASELLRFYQIAQAHRATMLQIYATAPPSDDARALAEQFSTAAVLHEPEELIAIAGHADMLPEEEVVKQALMQSIELRQKSRAKIGKRMLLPGNVRRYLYCAAIIALASFLTGYRVYYPIMAALCVCMALVSWYLGRKSTANQEASSKTQNVNS